MVRALRSGSTATNTRASCRRVRCAFLGITHTTPLCYVRDSYCLRLALEEAIPCVLFFFHDWVFLGTTQVRTAVGTAVV